MALTFRLATPADADALAALINEAFREDTTTEVFLHADHGPIDVTTPAEVAQTIARRDNAVLVGLDGDTMVTHCTVRKVWPGEKASRHDGHDGLDTDTTAWFGMFAVARDRQGHGLGTQVLAHAEEYARARWGATRMHFDVVNTRVGLQAWYARRGYAPTGETGTFPYKQHGDSWKGVLRDDLVMVYMGKDLETEDVK